MNEKSCDKKHIQCILGAVDCVADCHCLGYRGYAEMEDGRLPTPSTSVVGMAMAASS